MSHHAQPDDDRLSEEEQQLRRVAQARIELNRSREQRARGARFLTWLQRHLIAVVAVLIVVVILLMVLFRG